VSTAALVFWIIAAILFAFGVVFVALGLNSERAYWTQRDPSGDARTEATSLAAIIKQSGHFAAGEYRAPLRIAAIGVIMCEIAIGFAIIAVIATVTS
jgi:thiosulfate reductase cytochrome b subunit